MPPSQYQFVPLMEQWFPNFFDIKILIQDLPPHLRGGLSRLAEVLGVDRKGSMHQAGSDSLLTSEVFFKLKEQYMQRNFSDSHKNLLFGLGNNSEISENYYEDSQFWFQSNSNKKTTPIFRTTRYDSYSPYGYMGSPQHKQMMTHQQQIYSDYYDNYGYYPSASSPGVAPSNDGGSFHSTQQMRYNPSYIEPISN